VQLPGPASSSAPWPYALAGAAVVLLLGVGGWFVFAGGEGSSPGDTAPSANESSAEAAGSPSGAGPTATGGADQPAPQGEDPAEPPAEPSDDGPTAAGSDTGSENGTAEGEGETEPEADKARAESEQGTDDGSGSARAEPRGAGESEGGGTYEIQEPEIPAAVKRLSGRERHQKAQRMRRLARRLYRRQAYDKSETWWRRAWMHQPNSSANAAGLALVLQRQGNKEAAFAWAERAVELDSTDGHAHFVLGTILEKRGNTEQAADAYRRALKYGYGRARRRLRGL
jgi:hypothetical protein